MFNVRYQYRHKEFGFSQWVSVGASKTFESFDDAYAAILADLERDAGYMQIDLDGVWWVPDGPDAGYAISEQRERK